MKNKLCLGREQKHFMDEKKYCQMNGQGPKVWHNISCSALWKLGTENFPLNIIPAWLEVSPSKEPSFDPLSLSFVGFQPTECQCWQACQIPELWKLIELGVNSGSHLSVVWHGAYNLTDFSNLWLSHTQICTNNLYLIEQLWGLYEIVPIICWYITSKLPPNLVGKNNHFIISTGSGSKVLEELVWVVWSDLHSVSRVTGAEASTSQMASSLTFLTLPWSLFFPHGI